MWRPEKARFFSLETLKNHVFLMASRPAARHAAPEIDIVAYSPTKLLNADLSGRPGRPADPGGVSVPKFAMVPSGPNKRVFVVGVEPVFRGVLTRLFGQALVEPQSCYSP